MIKVSYLVKIECNCVKIGGEEKERDGVEGGKGREEG